jgi:YVTN family beta-propeller protein
MRARWPLLVASLLLASCGSDAETPTTDTDQSSTSDASSPTPEPSSWTDITDEGGEALPVADADWLQVAGGSVWTTLGGVAGASVQQLDATTGDPGAAVETPADTCTAMDVGYGSLWAAVCSEPSSSVLRIDPATGRVVARVPLKGAVVQYEGSLASAEGSVWVVTRTPRRSLVRIDPRTNRVVRTTDLPVGVTAVRAGLGGLWATDPDADELLRLDPRTGKTIATIAVGDGPRFFAVGEGAVWVQDNGAGTVSRVDPATNEVVATIEVDDGPVDGGDLAVGGGFVWARVSSWLVSKIDPATNEVVARYGPPSGSGSVAADDTAVWISAHDVDLVYRLPLE